MFLGIDFGTCFSCIAAISNAREATPTTHIFEKNVRKGIPSLFMYSRTLNRELFADECLIGEARLNSKDIVRYMKKTIRQRHDGLEQTVVSGGKTYKISDIVKAYLRYLIETAKQKARSEFNNPKIEAITITVPVGIENGYTAATDYNSWLKNMVMDIAGLPPKSIHILHEPVAAAICYLYSRDHDTAPVTNKQNILVFDLGGGTLDVTVVEHVPHENKSYSVKAEEGDLTLGGNDWDAELKKYILHQTGLNESSFSPEEKVNFLNEIIRLKEELSETSSYTIGFNANGQQYGFTCTRTEFDRITKGLLDRAIALTKQAINSCSDKIDKIILVGGASNMPQIKERMIQEFGDRVGSNNILSHEPSKAIAKGAAIYSKSNSSFSASAPLPKIRTIASKTYGFSAYYNNTEELRIYNMIFKGTPFGKKKYIRKESDTSFSPHTSHQDHCTFSIYESEARQGTGKDGAWIDIDSNTKQNNLSVSIPVPKRYYSKGNARNYKCYPKLTLTRDGILEIKICNKLGFKLASSRINL